MVNLFGVHAEKASKFATQEKDKEIIPEDPIRKVNASLPLTEHHTIKGISGHELAKDANRTDRRVIIAYDETEDARKAVEHYIDHVAQRNDHLFLLTVLKPLERHLDYSSWAAEEEATATGKKIDPRISGFYKARSEALDRLKEERERLNKRIADRNITLTLHVAHGDPKETIPRVSSYHEVQLIVVGRKTLTRWKKIFHPSVSFAVIEHTKIPVLVVQ